ncbi:MAG TPA: PQQ-dependent sugar dehydrogenase [Candidatus Binatia bacterium]|nr:PQQ-dependent sugar dehydrogenase [Candidatus Binatia bacterium]
MGVSPARRLQTRALPHPLALGIAVVVAAALVGCDARRQSVPPSSASAAPSAAATPPGSRPPSTPRPSGAAVDLDLGRLGITLEPLANVPGPALAMAAPDDGTGRLFVATQDGFIFVVQADGRVLERPMADLRGRITSGGEQGLLGIAVDADFATNQRVVVDYTNRDGDTVVESYTIDPNDPNRLQDNPTPILFVDQPFANHNGGAVAFGPDGMLYVSLGDGGGGGDPHGNGQRLDTHLAKILRVDIDAPADGRAYGIPGDNPYANGGGLPEIWLTGLRNPWRLSFDRRTGDLWIGDVGQGAWEEVDIAPQGVGGLNFGWRVMEGAHCYQVDPCNQDGLTLPVSEYGRDQGCTVIGGNVYRGSAFPFLVGAYLFADYCTGHIFAIDSRVRELTAPTVVGNGSNRIAAWGEDAAGELFVLALDGTVSRVVASER